MGRLGLFLGACAACGAPHIEKPPAPDMSRLVEAYDHPDAAFDQERAPDVVLAAAAAETLLEQTNLREQLVVVLQQVLEQAANLSGGGKDSLNLAIDADGYMRVTRICAGWDSPSTPDRNRNGALLVTATLTDSKLDPIVWGAAADCRYRVGETQIEIGQTRTSADALGVYWGESVEDDAIASRALLVDLNLVATIDGQGIPLDLDFRSLADGTVEYRVPQDDGALIARVGEQDSVTVRAANGTFDCDAELTCSPRAGAATP